jgi:hypothetical protein
LEERGNCISSLLKCICGRERDGPTTEKKHAPEKKHEERLGVGKEGGEEEVASEEKCWILPYVVGDSKFCLLLCAMQT